MRSELESANSEWVWSRFNQKYRSVGGDYSHIRARYQQPAVEPEFVNLELQRSAAIVLQRWYRSITNSMRTIPVNAKLGNHSDEFYNFVKTAHQVDQKQNESRSYPIRKHPNKTLQSLLLCALNLGDWNANIMQHSKLPQIAMALFAASKITRQSFSSIVEREQITDVFGQCHAYPLLSESNQFSSEAKQYFLPAITNLSCLPNLTPLQFYYFRNLAAALPKSEQFFFFADELLETSYVWLNLTNLDSRYSQHTLSNAAVPQYVIDEVSTTESKRTTTAMLTAPDNVVYMSAGVRDALCIVRFGLAAYSPMILRLGNLSIADIEQGVRKGVRFATVQYPGVLSRRNLHGAKNCVPLDITLHDFYHSQANSSIPLYLRSALLYIVDLFREQTGFNWSTLLWKLIDRDSYLFMTLKKKTLIGVSKAELFCRYFTAPFGEYDAKHKQWRIMSLLTMGHQYDENQLCSDMILLIAIDMVRNEHRWLQFGIKPAELVGTFRDAWLIAFNNQQHLNHCPTRNVMKLRIYLSLDDLSRLPYWLHLINFLKENISSIFKFKRNNADRFLGLTFISEDKSIRIDTNIEMIKEVYQVSYQSTFSMNVWYQALDDIHKEDTLRVIYKRSIDFFAKALGLSKTPDFDYDNETILTRLADLSEQPDKMVLFLKIFCLHIWLSLQTKTNEFFLDDSIKLVVGCQPAIDALHHIAYENDCASFFKHIIMHIAHHLIKCSLPLSPKSDNITSDIKNWLTMADLTWWQPRYDINKLDNCDIGVEQHELLLLAAYQRADFFDDMEHTDAAIRRYSGQGLVGSPLFLKKLCLYIYFCWDEDVSVKDKASRLAQSMISNPYIIKDLVELSYIDSALMTVADTMAAEVAHNIIITSMPLSQGKFSLFAGSTKINHTVSMPAMLDQPGDMKVDSSEDKGERKFGCN